MVVVTLVAIGLLGLVLGSFVNAFVWRLHGQQELEGKKSKTAREKLQKLSILHGRSMCPNCGHQLAAKDLVPILSWLLLGGKCRYCRKPISWQYPMVELVTSAIFLASYTWWPLELTGYGLFAFILWLVFLVGFVALAVYDIKWFLLPDRIVWPLVALAAAQVAVHVALWAHDVEIILDAIMGLAVASGFFYVLYVASKGRWIGGGDVKLGLVIGLVIGGPLPALLVLYFASVIGLLVSLPLLVNKKLKRSSLIPFGPFLLFGTVIVQLFGSDITSWLERLILG